MSPLHAERVGASDGYPGTQGEGWCDRHDSFPAVTIVHRRRYGCVHCIVLGIGWQVSFQSLPERRPWAAFAAVGVPAVPGAASARRT